MNGIKHIISLQDYFEFNCNVYIWVCIHWQISLFFIFAFSTVFPLTLSELEKERKLENMSVDTYMFSKYLQPYFLIF